MICYACGKCLTTEGVQRTIDGATVRLHATCAKKLDEGVIVVNAPLRTTK